MGCLVWPYMVVVVGVEVIYSGEDSLSDKGDLLGGINWIEVVGVHD